jgi:undecaprenyl-diphosphatase
MPLYHIVILAIIQGLTEFLPVSSSGHLVLTHHLLGQSTTDLCWETNRMMDVAVHVGTLLSVLLYFRKDLLLMTQGAFQKNKEGSLLFKNILIASIPVIIAGYVLHHYQPSLLCMLEVMAWMTLIFGIVLFIADKFKTDQLIKNMNTKNAFIIGLSQTLALIPGVSRSGITMTSARFLGFSRVEAAKFSLLLSIIAISGAGALSGLQLFETDNINLGFDILTAVLLSFISGYIAIVLMMKWLSKSSFTPFAIYRVILGIALLILIYGEFI